MPLPKRRRSPYRDLDWPAALREAASEDIGALRLAQRLGVSVWTVRNYAQLHGIDLRIRHRRSTKGINWPAELETARRTGLSAGQLADRLGVARGTVVHHTQRYGVPLTARRDWASEFRKAEADGETRAELARRLGVSRQAVSLAAAKLAGQE